MPNVAEIIKGHVTLEVQCVDRLYLNGYVPRLLTEGGGGFRSLTRLAWLRDRLTNMFVSSTRQED
jgi:hypothetical protein